MKTFSNNNNSRAMTKTLTMIQQHQYKEQQEEEDDLGDEINDKLSELWTGMKNKRKAMLRNLTPGHSRRSQRTLSSINNNTTTNLQLNPNISNIQANTKHSISLNNNHSLITPGITNQMINIKQKLSSSSLIKPENIKSLQQSSHHETSKIQLLIKELASNGRDNKQLLSQLKNYLQKSLQEQGKYQQDFINYNNQNQQITIQEESVDGKTANFYLNQKAKHHQDKHYSSTHMRANNNNSKKSCKKSSSKHQSSSVKDKHYPNKENLQNYNNNNNSYYNTQNHSQSQSHQQSQSTYLSQQILPSLQANRLIQLLKSTSQYRQFAYYYDSHELSYLKRLQQQHKKNCSVNLSQKEKQYWAPTQLIQRMASKNIKNNWGLNEQQLEQIIGEMKIYFEHNQQSKLKQQKQHYVKKIQKLKRQKQNNIPYDLVRLSNARQRKKQTSKRKSDCSNMGKNMRQ